ncbi:MAG: ATP synthase subunit I [Cyanobacteria bacterium P01_C01_bin.72]
MSQAKTSWQQAFNTCRLMASNQQFRRLTGQAACLAVFAFLWWMNWKLFLATSVGIGAMSVCYLAQNSHWQSYCQRWRKFFVGSNRQLTLAIGTGASGAFCTYLAASVWADADNQWLATGSILQGFISLTTLCLLLWSLRGKQASSLEAKLERLLIDLSDCDRLKRLVAIRQLTRLLVSNRLSADHYSQSIEYYRLMLSEPQPAVIKDALLESLDVLGADKILQSSNLVKLPLQLQRKPQRVFDPNS